MNAHRALQDAIATVPGWLTEEEAALLHDLAHTGPGDGRVVELGSAQGRSTLCLALGLRARGDALPLLAVDTHQGSPEHQPGGAWFDPAMWDEAAGRVDTLPALRRHLAKAGVEGHVEPWVGTTTAAAAAFEGRVRLLFVDADHDEAAVRADIAAWQPHLAPDALILLHDVGVWPGPTAVADELASGGYRVAARAGSLLALAPIALPAAPPTGLPADQHPLQQAWRLALAGDPAARAQWRYGEGGRWAWEGDCLRAEGDGTEWVSYDWEASAAGGLRALPNCVVEITVSGRGAAPGAAVGLSFGPWMDFLVPLGGDPNPRRLQLEIDATADRWALRVDGQMQPRQWWDGAVRSAADLLDGTLALKARHAADVRFRDFAVHALDATCRLSVIITCHRFQQRLRLALLSWCAQEMPAGAHEIIVVNPASPDGTHETVAAFARAWPHVRVHELYVEDLPATNKGRLINRGLAQAAGDWIWLTDADCLFAPDAARRALAAAEAQPHALWYGARRHLSPAQTDALLAGRLDPVRDFAALAEDSAPHAVDAHPWGYTQIVRGRTLGRLLYRENVEHFAWTDEQFVADCRRQGIQPQRVEGLLCLHLAHPFAWYGTPHFL